MLCAWLRLPIRALIGTGGAFGVTGADGPSVLLPMEFPMSKTRKIGRSAKDGRFTSIKKAQQQTSTHVVETLKVTKKKG